VSRFRSIHLVVPGPLDRRTGGYLYDARIVRELRSAGYRVRVHELAGSFPDVDGEARAALDRALDLVAPGDVAVVDGLAGGAAPDVLRRHAPDQPLVALVHHPLADETGMDPERAARLRATEADALAACRGVIVTSPFTKRRLADFGVPPLRVHVVEPGIDRVTPASGPPPGDPPRLLCVASLTPRKGLDVLVRALAELESLSWTCHIVGSDTLDPEHAAEVRRLITLAGLERRVTLTGELSGAALDREYREASIFTFPSRYEGYGMALVEALAYGLPVVSTTGGAIPDTVPASASVLVPPDDPPAFAGALASLLAADPARLRAIRAAARRHADALRGWRTAADEFAAALEAVVGPEPPAREVFDRGWLSARERADHRARSPGLAQRFAQHLETTERPSGEGRGAPSALRILDLGSGTGSNVRYLTSRLSDAHWVLLDHDVALLNAAYVPLAPERVQRIAGDLAHAGLDAIDGTHGVTASALLDLVSRDWLEELVRRTVARSVPVLFALTYDGRVEWRAKGDRGAARGASKPDGTDSEDRWIRELVNRHQRRDKGLGPALGPGAARLARQLYERAGYRTWEAQTPWRLDHETADLGELWIQGWVAAAVEQAPGGSAPRGRRRAERGPPGPPGTSPGRRRDLGMSRDGRGSSRGLPVWLRWLSGPFLLGLLLLGLDGGAVLHRLKAMDPTWCVAAIGTGVFYTTLSAWRWRFTAGRLGLSLPFRSALAEYYASIFLNQVLPGGVLGDASRAIRHARETGSSGGKGTAVRAVVLERLAAQVVMTSAALVCGAVVVVPALGHTVPRPAVWITVLVLTVAGAGVLGRLLARATRRRASGHSWRGDLYRAVLAPAAVGIQLLSAVLVVLAYVLMYVVAARAVGVVTPLPALAPLVPPILITMLLPVSVAGWGFREAAAAAVWSLAGMGAAEGTAVSVAYGILVLAASAPGAAVWAWSLARGHPSRPAGRRHRRPEIEVEEDITPEDHVAADRA